MYNDVTVASQYEWNKNRRATPKPKAKLHSKSYKCLQGSETFEIKDCEGKPHINLKSKNVKDFMEYFISDWIKVDSSE